MPDTVVRIMLVLLLGTAAIGCSSEKSTLGDTADPPVDSVIGVVTKIDDHVPVDGGVVLELQLPGGEKDAAYLPSFFTHPPPPPESNAVYQVILGLKIGDRVQAEGERTPSGIKLARLRVLSPKP